MISSSTDPNISLTVPKTSERSAVKLEYGKARTHYASQETKRRDAKYVQTGLEYEALFAAVQKAHPTLGEAQFALGTRLLKDIGAIASKVYCDMFTELPDSKSYEWATSAEEWANHYAQFTLKRIEQGRFKTSREILGFRLSIKKTLKRQARKELNLAHKRESLTVPCDPDDEYDDRQNSKILKVAQVTLLPLEILEVFTNEERCILATLDAYGGDRKAVAAHFGMRVGTLNKRIERIGSKGALEHLKLTITEMLANDTPDTLVESLAAHILPLISILQTVPLGEWSDSFDALSLVSSDNDAVCNRYQATVRHILRLWLSKPCDALQATNETEAFENIL
jgi:hypothetical protein